MKQLSKHYLCGWLLYCEEGLWGASTVRFLPHLLVHGVATPQGHERSNSLIALQCNIFTLLKCKVEAEII